MIRNLRKAHFSFADLSKYRTELYGFSILWIMLFHAYLCSVRYPPLPNAFLDFGNMGCEIFLMTSGISLYFSWQKNGEPASFLHRRFLRLFIPMVLICSGHWLWLWAHGELRFALLVSNYLMLSFWITGRAQIWFLSFLLPAYMLYPYIYGFLYRMRGNRACKTLLLVLLSMGIAVVLYRVVPAYYKKVEIALTRLPIFLIGCALGRTVYERRCIEKHDGLLLAALALLFAGSLLLLNLGLLHGMFIRYFYLLPGTAFTLLLSQLFAAVKNGAVHRVFCFFGSMSLELYLTHITGIALYRRSAFYTPGSLPRYLILLLICTLIAFAASKLDVWLLAQLQQYVFSRSEKTA